MLREEEQRKNKEQSLEERLESIRQRQEDRQRRQAEWIQQMKALPKPLYRIMEEDYNKNVYLP